MGRRKYFSVYTVRVAKQNIFKGYLIIFLFNNNLLGFVMQHNVSARILYRCNQKKANYSGWNIARYSVHTSTTEYNFSRSTVLRNALDVNIFAL